jgi:hypothetical protein
MLNKDDVERITRNVLEKLTIEVVGNWPSAERTVILKLDGEEITRSDFDVTHRTDDGHY